MEEELLEPQEPEVLRYFSVRFKFMDFTFKTVVDAYTSKQAADTALRRLNEMIPRRERLKFGPLPEAEVVYGPLIILGDE